MRFSPEYADIKGGSTSNTMLIVKGAITPVQCQWLMSVSFVHNHGRQIHNVEIQFRKDFKRYFDGIIIKREWVEE